MTSKGKILAVDDEDGITEYLQTLFKGVGYDVETASGGWEAWEKIDRNSFDFVITDVRMDRGDGIELVEKIRDMPEPKPQIAILSAYTDVLISDIYDRGVVAFISKPPKPGVLIDTVKKALSTDTEKWGLLDKLSDDHSVELSFESIEEVLKDGQISFGRGGMFVHVDTDDLVENEPIFFQINFKSGELKKIKGKGIARWIRQARSRNFYVGLGIELVGLCPESKAYILNRIENMKPEAFIPVGSISKSPLT